jgi:hypothetical protein
VRCRSPMRWRPRCRPTSTRPPRRDRSGAGAALAGADWLASPPLRRRPVGLDPVAGGRVHRPPRPGHARTRAAGPACADAALHRRVRDPSLHRAAPGPGGPRCSAGPRTPAPMCAAWSAKAAGRACPGACSCRPGGRPRAHAAAAAALQDDPSEDVRRSVANHLNDIAKDHPAWWPTGCAGTCPTPAPSAWPCCAMPAAR